jgi:hypothetical protein
MNIELTNNELDVLVQLLDKELKMLPVEIHHTKHREFKDYLKEREFTLETLHDRIEKRVKNN